MEAQRQAGYRAYSGQGACREDGIYSEAGRLPGELPGAGELPRYRVTACMGGCAARQKGNAADGLSAYSGQGACRGDGISSGADILPGGLPGAGELLRYRVTACMGLCRLVERQYSRQVFRTPGQECIGKMVFPPVLVHYPAGFCAAAGIPRYMGNTAPKQIPPPHRPGRAAGVFSCMGTGRIRLRHRATWRQWGSRERRLPKPGRR